MRFVIVGMCNPQGNPPLWTDPPGCAGHRLWQMATARTGISQEDWLAITDRRNLCLGKEWCREEARISAHAMVPELSSRTTVLLGGEVASCFPSCGLIGHWAKGYGTPPRNPRPWVTIPHPSGMCRWYNEAANRAAVEILLGDLVELCTKTEET